MVFVELLGVKVMAFGQCENCAYELDKPLISEDLGVLSQICPHCKDTQSRYMTVDEWSIQIYEEHLELVKKFEELKKVVDSLEKKTRFRSDGLIGPY